MRALKAGSSAAKQQQQQQVASQPDTEETWMRIVGEHTPDQYWRWKSEFAIKLYRTMQHDRFEEVSVYVSVSTSEHQCRLRPHSLCS